MKIVPIFMFGATLDEGGLFAAKFDGEVIDEYNMFIDSMFDDSFLYDFFNNNIADISNGYFDYTIDNAIQQTRNEVFNLEASILDIAEGGIKNEITLDRLFVALNDYVFEFKPLRTSKAKATLIGLKSPWCRLYAIRIDANLYVVTGGTIKLTRSMQERGHTIAQLKKINKVLNYLKENDIITVDNLKDFYEGES